jgi:site-specific DNA recombinase
VSTRRALVYCRISSDPEHDLLGVTRQLDDCRALAERLGWEIVGEYVDDDVSAYSGKPRPQYEALLEALRGRTGNAVLAWHPDRLHRSPRELESFIDLVELTKAKVQTCRAGEYDLSTPSGRTTARIVGAVARGESEHKSDRVRAKLKQNADMGKVAGGANRPFGYDDDKITVMPTEAAIVREIAARLLAGETLRGVCAWVNSTGVKTTGWVRRDRETSTSEVMPGRDWTPGRIKSIAVNPRYSGQRAVGTGANAKVTNENAWEAIIDASTTDKLRALLLDPDRRTNRSARKYLLSGHVTCEACGSNMLARPRVRDGKTQRRYVCVNDPGRHGCGRNTVTADDLEEAIGDLLVVRFEKLARTGAFKIKGSMIDDEVSAETAVIDSKLATLARQWANDDITDGERDAARAALIERRNRLSTRVRRDVSAIPAILAEFAADPTRLRAEWEKLPFDRKRAFVVALIDSIVLTPAPGAPQFAVERLVREPWKA